MKHIVFLTGAGISAESGRTAPDSTGMTLCDPGDEIFFGDAISAG